MSAVSSERERAKKVRASDANDPSGSDARSRRPIRQPQQERSRRTREGVLEAASQCFEECGYDETTTAMIAERAGIAVGTLYDYFQDKRDILLEILDAVAVDVFDLVIEKLDPESWRGRDPREWCRSLIDLVFHSQSLQPGIQRIMWERYFKDPQFRDAFDGIRDKMRKAIGRFMDGIAEQGQLRDLDRVAAAEVVLNAVQWNATQAFLRGSPESTNAVAETVSDLVVRFLFVDEEQPPVS
jgi:AcrR family transcriptional regulator